MTLVLCQLHCLPLAIWVQFKMLAITSKTLDGLRCSCLLDHIYLLEPMAAEIIWGWPFKGGYCQIYPTWIRQEEIFVLLPLFSGTPFLNPCEIWHFCNYSGRDIRQNWFSWLWGITNFICMSTIFMAMHFILFRLLHLLYVPVCFNHGAWNSDYPHNM